jgi:hypothetical protein
MPLLLLLELCALILIVAGWNTGMISCSTLVIVLSSGGDDSPFYDKSMNVSLKYSSVVNFCQYSPLSIS